MSAHGFGFHPEAHTRTLTDANGNITRDADHTDGSGSVDLRYVDTYDTTAQSHPHAWGSSQTGLHRRRSGAARLARGMAQAGGDVGRAFWPLAPGVGRPSTITLLNPKRSRMLIAPRRVRTQPRAANSPSKRATTSRDVPR